NSAIPGAIELDGYLRFDDGASIQIVQLYNSAQNFQMFMPKLPASSVTIAAVVGSTPSGPYSVGHVDGLTPGQGGVALNVPAPVSQVAPVPGASNVGPTSMFQWSASPRVAMLYIECASPNSGEGPTRFFVVTEDYKTPLPIFTGGIAWPKG